MIKFTKIFLFTTLLILSFGFISNQAYAGSASDSVTVTVTAPPVNGACSTSHYICTSGTSVSNVDGATAWTWGCNGSNGGTSTSATSCTEAKPINGACSTSHYICTSGTSVSNVENASGWTWGCNGSNGGTSTSATACTEAKAIPVVDCVSSWSDTNTCSVTACGSTGVKQQIYTIKTAASGGGTACPYANGATRWGTTSCSTAACDVMSGTITANNCTIASGGSSCSSSISWSTTNPVSTSAVTTPTNITVGSGNNSSASYTVSYGSRSFFLYNNGVLLGSDSATASCVSGTTWDGAKCAVAATMSGTITANNCTIASGGSSCSSSISWSTTNPVSTSAVTTPTNITVGSGNNSSASYTVSYGSRSFFLYNNGVLLGSDSATASCVSGTTWDGAKCVTSTPPPSCSNGADNYPVCTTTGGGTICLNGATNPPVCTTTGGGTVCVNGATNPPTCDTFSPTAGFWSDWSPSLSVCPGAPVTQTKTYTKATNGGVDDPAGLSNPIQTRTVDPADCPIVDVSVTRDGLPVTVRIPYNGRVKVGWTATKASDCSCSYYDIKTGANPGSCGNGTSYIYQTPSLKKDTKYTIVCNGGYGISISGVKNVLVDPINTNVIEQ